MYQVMILCLSQATKIIEEDLIRIREKICQAAMDTSKTGFIDRFRFNLVLSFGKLFVSCNL